MRGPTSVIDSAGQHHKSNQSAPFSQTFRSANSTHPFFRSDSLVHGLQTFVNGSSTPVSTQTYTHTGSPSTTTSSKLLTPSTSVTSSGHWTSDTSPPFVSATRPPPPHMQVLDVKPPLSTPTLRSAITDLSTERTQPWPEPAMDRGWLTMPKGPQDSGEKAPSPVPRSAPNTPAAAAFAAAQGHGHVRANTTHLATELPAAGQASSDLFSELETSDRTLPAADIFASSHSAGKQRRTDEPDAHQLGVDASLHIAGSHMVEPADATSSNAWDTHASSQAASWQPSGNTWRTPPPASSASSPFALPHVNAPYRQVPASTGRFKSLDGRPHAQSAPYKRPNHRNFSSLPSTGHYVSDRQYADAPRSSFEGFGHDEGNADAHGAHNVPMGLPAVKHDPYSGEGYAHSLSGPSQTHSMPDAWRGPSYTYSNQTDSVHYPYGPSPVHYQHTHAPSQSHQQAQQNYIMSGEPQSGGSQQGGMPLPASSSYDQGYSVNESMPNQEQLYGAVQSTASASSADDSLALSLMDNKDSTHLALARRPGSVAEAHDYNSLPGVVSRNAPLSSYEPSLAPHQWTGHHGGAQRIGDASLPSPNVLQPSFSTGQSGHAYSPMYAPQPPTNMVGHPMAAPSGFSGGQERFRHDAQMPSPYVLIRASQIPTSYPPVPPSGHAGHIGGSLPLSASVAAAGPSHHTTATFDFRDNMIDIAHGWAPEEYNAKRRLVRFDRQQNNHVISAWANPVEQAQYRPGTGGMVVSCIFREDRNECYITSVDIIALLEFLCDGRFSVEEKNRVRRNLEGFRPVTVAKGKRETSEFFSLIMAFPEPKPRNIEKDVKVFPWHNLAEALRKIISKYALCNRPVSYR